MMTLRLTFHCADRPEVDYQIAPVYKLRMTENSIFDDGLAGGPLELAEFQDEFFYPISEGNSIGYGYPEVLVEEE